MKPEYFDQPLITSRGCYQSLWNNEDPFAAVPSSHDIKLVNRITTGQFTVADLAGSWKNRGRPYPALLLRVLHRARIFNYGNPDKTFKWPYQFHVTAADNTGVVTVVFWNQLFKHLYNRLSVGTVFVVHNYVIKASRFQILSQPAVRQSQIPVFQLEIDVNHQNPAGEIDIINPGALDRSRRLPALKFLFYTRVQLTSLPNNFIIDYAGVVTHVGCYERQRRSDTASEFFLCRWIELMDGTSSNPVRLQLYATSQPDIHEKIQPGVVVVVTQLRVVTSFGVDSRHQRPVYVTSTRHTQVSVHDDSIVTKEPFVNDCTIEQLIKWKHSRTGISQITACLTIGGRYLYPPLLTNFQTYTSSFTQEKPFQLSSAGSFKLFAESLFYREYRRLHFKGVIAQVTLHHAATVQSHPGYNLRSQNEVMHGASRKTLLGVSDGGVSAKRRKQHVAVQDSSHGDAEFCAATKDGLVFRIDKLWERLEPTLTVVGSSHAHPSMYRRKYTSPDDASVINDCLLMPRSVYKAQPAGSKKLKDLEPVAQTDHDCIQLTIVGVNNDIAIRAFLPASCRQPETASRHRSECHLCDRINSCLTLAGSRPTRSRDLAALERRRFVFVLDVYSPGDDVGTEVTVVHGYEIESRSGDRTSPE